MSDEGSVGGGGGYDGGVGGFAALEQAFAALMGDLRQKQAELAEGEERVKQVAEEWRARKARLDQDRCVCPRIGPFPHLYPDSRAR